MRQSCLLLLAIALAGCTSRAVQQLHKEADPFVGKDYWITGIVTFCPDPKFRTTCAQLSGKPFSPSNAHVKIDGVDQKQRYHVTLDDGRTGYIVTYELLRMRTDTDPEKAAADCKRRGDPRIGMTAKQVEATCWGKPDHLNQTQTAVGISDQYVYGDSRYVYLQ